MIEFKEELNLDLCMDLWNQEMGFIYPITKSLYDQNVTNYNQKKVFVAYKDDVLVGFVIAKKYENEDLMSYNNLGFISLIYVAKKHRKQGIGSSLLRLAEEYLKDKTTINIGKDIYNFFPGVPCDFDNLTDIWLEKRGYVGERYTHDLINYNPKKIPLREDNFTYKLCTLEDKDALLEFMKNNFQGRWYFEASSYFANGGTGKEYSICKDQDKVIAFARTNDRDFSIIHYNTTWYHRFNNLGGVGPLGVDKNYRGLNLGYNIVAYGINTLIDKSITEIIIDWTGLLEFYQQFGFEVWKSFKYMAKKG